MRSAGGGSVALSASDAPSEEGADCSAERLEEAEALRRIGALVERMAEMESWFAGVQAEAERERRMREQATARLALMAERVDKASAELAALRDENAALRSRLENVHAAQEELAQLQAAGTSVPANGAATMRQMRTGLEAAAHNLAL